MLGSILSAFTLLAVIKIALDLVAADPDNLDSALAALVVASTLAAYLLFIPG